MFTGVLTGSSYDEAGARPASSGSRPRMLRQAVVESHPVHLFGNPDVFGWCKRVAVVECGKRNASDGTVPSPSKQPRAAIFAKHPVERFR
jgi:hypothetical protein